MAEIMLMPWRFLVLKTIAVSPSCPRCDPLGMIDVSEMSASGAATRDDNVRVSAFIVEHPPVKPAFGYRSDFKDPRSRSPAILRRSKLWRKSPRVARGRKLRSEEDPRRSELPNLAAQTRTRPICALTRLGHSIAVAAELPAELTGGNPFAMRRHLEMLFNPVKLDMSARNGHRHSY
jgi:hypothetical protein